MDGHGQCELMFGMRPSPVLTESDGSWVTSNTPEYIMYIAIHLNMVIHVQQGSLSWHDPALPA
jgi:hypothetical protein